MVLNPFFRLIQIAIGQVKEREFKLSEQELLSCYHQAEKHGLQAILLPVVLPLLKSNSLEQLYSSWFSSAYIIDSNNRLLNERAVELTKKLKSWGYEGCVLKGQGVAQLYPTPETRQGGDIDMWVKGDREDILSCIRHNSIGIRNIDYVHSGIYIFHDAEVEIHFRPSWLYNPLFNRRLQNFFRDNENTQFSNYDDKVGFSYPTVSFNLVYSLIHINRHIFEEGIGLRQLLDYFYILKHSAQDERCKAFAVLSNLGLKKFVGAIMYIMQEVFQIERELLLCKPNTKEGEFLLEEILRAGNFGHYDERNEWIEPSHRFKRGFINAKHNFKYLRHYPNEVMWIPVWKIWHWCWRKYKGYL